MEVIGERGKRHFVYANLLICLAAHTTESDTRNAEFLMKFNGWKEGLRCEEGTLPHEL